MRIDLLILVIIITIVEVLLFQLVASKRQRPLSRNATLLVISIIIWGIVVVATIVPYMKG